MLFEDVVREAALGILRDIWSHWVEAAILIGVLTVFRMYVRGVMR